MKKKKVQARLEERRKAFDVMSSNQQKGYKRPGSMSGRK